MRVAALSDLHIGLDPTTDAFQHRADAFARFLDDLLGQHDRVVLLGDIFAADHAAGWGERFAQAHLRRILTRVPWLSDRLAHDRVHYVHGNHDLAAAAVLGAAERVVLGEGAYRAMFVHGHQFDPGGQKALILAQTGTGVTGRMRAFGLRRTAQWFEDRDVEIKDVRFRGPAGPYASAADALCRQSGVRAVVMGHTHAARVDVMPHGLSLNTGSCSCGRREYVSLDLARGVGWLVRGFERISVSLLK